VHAAALYKHQHARAGASGCIELLDPVRVISASSKQPVAWLHLLYCTTLTCVCLRSLKRSRSTCLAGPYLAVEAVVGAGILRRT
jgi:hypothetical protein